MIISILAIKKSTKNGRSSQGSKGSKTKGKERQIAKSPRRNQRQQCDKIELLSKV